MRQRIRNDGYQDEIKMDTQWLKIGKLCNVSLTEKKMVKCTKNWRKMNKIE